MLIKNTTVLKADGRVLPGRVVGIRDGRIACVADQAPQGDWGRVIDGSRYLVMPGMVNAHTHAAMTLMRGYGDDRPLDRWLHDYIFPFEDELTGEDVYWASLLGIAEMLAGGVTSFSDMFFFCMDTLKAVRESGIKANLSRGVSCFDASLDFKELPAYRDMLELLAALSDDPSGRVRADAAPHAEYTLTPRVIAGIADAARARGMRIQVHLSETYKEHMDCVQRWGRTPVQVMHDAGIFENPVTAAHGVWLTDSDMDILAAHDVTVAHCPQSNMKLACGIARIDCMKSRGIPVALGTDSAASNNNLNLLEEARLAALLRKGISLDPEAARAGDTLYMLTRAGALSQGRGDCGDIEEGYCADMVLMDMSAACMTPCHNAASNVLYAAGSAEVAMTIVDGHVLYEHGSFTSIDIEKVRAEASRRTLRITSKTGATV